nr:unnamed protein product [Callosobruchus chinensis]
MWTLRRMLKISWTEHVRNDNLLRMAGVEDRELFDHTKKRKISYLGHIIRGERYELQRLILQETIEGGRRGIGRKKTVLAQKYPPLNGYKRLPIDSGIHQE